jgi:hypothetical protein
MVTKMTQTWFTPDDGKIMCSNSCVIQKDMKEKKEYKEFPIEW